LPPICYAAQSGINVKQISGYSIKELVEELDGIYLELRDIELNLQ
jgi:hypothetical protein